MASAALGLAAFSVSPAMAQDDAASVESTAPAAEEAPAPVDASLPAPGTKEYFYVNPSLDVDPDNILLLDLSDGGRVAIRLKPEWAPHHVARIKELTRQGFYDGVIFHRVIDGFMAQTGDPTGTGRGGSQLPDLKAEFNTVPHLRGTVSMARNGDSVDSGNSQFFIVFYPVMQIDKQYTNFGRVIGGMAYVDAIARGQPPAKPTRILQASLASDNKAPPSRAPAGGEITSDMLNAPIGADQPQ